jgi:starch synthase
MYVVMITPECAPVAKVGGLGDVAQGLSYELSIRGNSVELILPKYDCMRYDRIWGLSPSFQGLMVPFHGELIHCDVWFGFIDGLKCYFIDPHSHHLFFNRGVFYGHRDDVERFAFFCRAALEFLHKAGKNPDIIHCHDWQTGIVPLLLFELYKYQGFTHPRVCYTIHNIGHQGLTSEHTLRQVGIDPGYHMRTDRCQDDYSPYTVNLMKTGIVFSNFITTVSPRYAEEVRTSTLGHGLQPVLNRHSDRFSGVLNGIDYNVWNPEIDRHIPFPYTVENIAGKYSNSQALRDRLLLRQESKPIVSVVGRLDRQKGVELVRHAMFYALSHACQFVLLGSSPDAKINHDFWRLKHQFNDNPDCHLELAYNEELSHLIYAGADMIVIPSIYEPCGLTQMIGMKYGTVPIVRNTGGLADTVFDADHSPRPVDERNGYVFNDYNYEGLESAMSRAIDRWYADPDGFRQLAINAMNTDYSWNLPASEYLAIYERIREK